MEDEGDEAHDGRMIARRRGTSQWIFTLGPAVRVFTPGFYVGRFRPAKGQTATPRLVVGQLNPTTYGDEDTRKYMQQKRSWALFRKGPAA